MAPCSQLLIGRPPLVLFSRRNHEFPQKAGDWISFHIDTLFTRVVRTRLSRYGPTR
jgi:hypothetical protein